MKYGNVWSIQGILSTVHTISLGPEEVITDLKVGFYDYGIRYVHLNTSEGSKLLAGRDAGETYEEIHGKRLLCIAAKRTSSIVTVSELTFIMSV